MFKKLGVEVQMLTGDNKKTAEYIGGLAGVDKVIAEVLPAKRFKLSSRGACLFPRPKCYAEHLPCGYAHPRHEAEGIALSRLPKQVKAYGSKPCRKQEAYACG